MTPPQRLRVVFLDIDGVLNSSKFWQDIGSDVVTWTVRDIDPRAVALLNELAPAEITRIVVSSVWRRQGLRPIRELLERAGVQARVIGVTPNFHEDYARGREIASWLRDHGAGPETGAGTTPSSDPETGVGPHRLRGPRR